MEPAFLWPPFQTPRQGLWLRAGGYACPPLESLPPPPVASSLYSPPSLVAQELLIPAGSPRPLESRNMGFLSWDPRGQRGPSQGKIRQVMGNEFRTSSHPECNRSPV